eukprot:TRINITY_DN74689_c0_g1_i1.p1 TRINITY_DN74689_c0_g1~~TRINITY_DN74689_c0_g1_i1.p1  ORF type:complete len:185 (-),score=51.51 TRINITY_DN74689_c0_g1_i1:309-863(-)
MAARGSRHARALPLFPCVCFGLGMVMLFIVVGTSLLPESSEAQGFVGGGRQEGLRGAAVQRRYKPTAADRGTPEYEEYMARKRKERKEDWEAYSKGGYDDKVGSQFANMGEMTFDRSVGNVIPSAPSPSAPAPAPVQQQQASSGGSSEGGNPFQFLVDLFQGTTTTTTTTPPPTPFESFMKMFR